MTTEASLFARLYLDEDVHKSIAFALRLRQFDALSAHEFGAWGLTDEQQLALAIQQGRVLYTFNAAHFVSLHKRYLREGIAHSGIIVSEQLEVGEAARRLLALLNRVSADEMRNQLYWLPASQ